MGDLTDALPGSDYNAFEGMSGAPVFGKPSSAAKKEMMDLIRASARPGIELWDTTKGIRGDITKTLGDFTSGNLDVTSMPMFAPGKTATENAYKSARENIISGMPAGGAMLGELGNLEADRASKLTDIIGQIQQDLFTKAYGAGYGVPAAATGGVSSSANTMAQLLNQQQASAGQNAQGIGQMVGYMSSK